MAERDRTERAMQRAAARATDSGAFEVVARFGYFASGLAHVLIGLIALRIDAGSAGTSDTTGAVAELAAQPGGNLLVAACFGGCLALALFQLSRMLLAGRRLTGWELVKDRASDSGQVVVYGGVGAIFGSFVFGTRRADGGPGWTAELLSVPAGQQLLAAVGAGVLAGAAWFLWLGVSRRFLRQLRLFRGEVLNRAVRVVGVIGYLAKGLSLAIIGGLIITAAATADPTRPTGLDAALRVLRDQPYGVLLLGATGVGLIAYGLYIGVVRALFQRL